MFPDCILLLKLPELEKLLQHVTEEKGIVYSLWNQAMAARKAGHLSGDVAA